MKKEMEISLIKETIIALERYWQKDAQYVTDRLYNKAGWIGSAPSQYMTDREDIIKDMEQTTQEIQHCYLTHKDFRCVLNIGKICVIVGRYLVHTDPDVSEELHEEQRCTFVWIQDGKEIKISHIHVSDPVAFLDNDEVFPHRVGKMTYMYMNKEKRRERDETLIVDDLNNYACVLPLSQVLYITSEGHHSIVITKESSITSKANFSSFDTKLAKAFLKVHRCYLVNKENVVRFGDDFVEMTDGSKVPLAKRNRKKIIDKFYNELDHNVYHV